MNYRKPVCLVVILFCLLCHLSVMAQNKGNNPNKGNNRRNLGIEVAGWNVSGKHLVVVGYGGAYEYERRDACAGYRRASSFFVNELKWRLEKAGIQVASLRLIDGGYLNEPWIDVYALGPSERFPGPREAAPPQGRCAR
jgi:hypothetical protein